MTISEYYQPCYQSEKCNREEETKTLLKLIVARKSISYEGRISLKDMQDEYYFLSNKKEIPFEEMGYYSLNHLLRKIPEIIPDNEDDHSEIMYKINHWCPEQLIEDLEEKLKILGNGWDRYNKRGSYKYSSKRSKISKRSSSSFCSASSDYQSWPTASNWSSEDDTCSSLSETSLKPLIFIDNQEDKKKKSLRTNNRRPTINRRRLLFATCF